MDNFDFFANFPSIRALFFSLLGFYIAWGHFPAILRFFPYRFDTSFILFQLILALPVIRPFFHMGFAYVFSIGLFGPYRFDT